MQHSDDARKSSEDFEDFSAQLVTYKKDVWETSWEDDDIEEDFNIKLKRMRTHTGTNNDDTKK